ncbi:sugar O-acetyltransferase [Lactococcus nasutitermitis]|uniref:Sugar O-acetyltransferase n=1 Tax=Lactococcus nasutitermitis TaxID=1652957 RepID=A0ABV9JEP2_9LACT|nr:sugar O-acetyltransferase [Lactococcus nasutitermitis]
MIEDFDYNQMLAGELYLAGGILPENRSTAGKIIAQKLNQTPFENKAEIATLTQQLFGKIGKNSVVTPPVYVDYGRHVEIGDDFYANLDCLFLDVNKIIIGNHVMLGPRVALYTAGHPTVAKVRNTELEFGLPIVIKDNVWVGGSTTILPGVTIGENAVIGAASVVTKDVPANTIVAGNPAKIIRQIDEKEKVYWQQKMADYHLKKSQQN